MLRRVNLEKFMSRYITARLLTTNDSFTATEQTVHVSTEKKNDLDGSVSL